MRQTREHATRHGYAYTLIDVYAQLCEGLYWERAKGKKQSKLSWVSFIKPLVRKAPFTLM